MKIKQHHDGWLASVVALATMALPMATSATEDEQFEQVSVYLERNVQDRDAEIKFEVTGASEGLTALRVSAPGERTVIDLKTPDSKLGIRKLTIESPEPADDRIVKADFPAGAYRFEGSTNKGVRLRGEARLSHAFPEPAMFEYPRSGQKDVSAADLTVRWSVPKGIESCVIVIEQNGSPYEIRALVPASTKTFAVPKGFLRAGQAYTLAIGTVAKDGNRSFIETEFSTARER
ncbi:hypothetical protein [Bradyrhizobium japonicum]|uniref:hypothetical protein n=1 Tax=Bradyrhizobium japonicum TaxID=375 RepID=UPI000456CDFD|nr:hypothetical protein [Bradyrhizobium japonicum]AHY51519.1 hypothetical protein BJS_04372 [Bradyrhizobium japonicum SEMIA 5079]MCD9105372.1 hypothetical protein [Bradyrhizobium japonicum]MCD9259275.1 hypothetical protein [Bradyrhizobium japonicum SEMIA 5079]MCD9820252.1 hypothetical protein [Bradyrhizobium japonicum]MCD9892499.1 hypothetical protein [Bradyrhizobium japonicum]